MALTLEPMGQLVIHIDESWNFMDGPLCGRSCTSMREVVWDSDRLKARSVWANGSYRNGPEIAEVNVRVLFRTDDDALMYLDYDVRVHLPTHMLPVGNEEKTPAIMSGRIETHVGNQKYAWLHSTQVVGAATLDRVAKTQTYEMYALKPSD